jgi:hypothetical protein
MVRHSRQTTDEKEEKTTTMNLAFTDTETTGTEEEDRLLQLAYRCGGKDVNELYRPPVPINLMAMATHQSNTRYKIERLCTHHMKNPCGWK